MASAAHSSGVAAISCANGSGAQPRQRHEAREFGRRSWPGTTAECDGAGEQPAAAGRWPRSRAISRAKICGHPPRACASSAGSGAEQIARAAHAAIAVVAAAEAALVGADAAVKGFRHALDLAADTKIAGADLPQRPVEIDEHRIEKSLPDRGAPERFPL